MAKAVTVSSSGGGLSDLHSRLDAHFLSLRDRREPTRPTFVLEHGLPEDQIASLKDDVRAAISENALDEDAWLPFVVYCTEMGYEYVGHEYWQTFEAHTPKWSKYGDRHLVRDLFEKFESEYGGAHPCGRWAEHFSIIAWPLTHAVLPKDLQQQLAELLYQYRSALTSEQLQFPDVLGKRLAARCRHTSSRFRQFAQNTVLLGHVSATLYLDSAKSDDQLLLPATRDRLVKDISKESQAKSWLNGARQKAQLLERKGFLRDTESRAPSEAVTTGGRSVDPRLVLIGYRDGWAAELELNDLSALIERWPELGEELEERRCLVNGSDASPQARGSMLRPGRRIRLDRWPDPLRPLFELEGGSQELYEPLDENCTLGLGPWLFKKRDPGVAVEVKGKKVRSGGEYVVLSAKPMVQSEPRAWIEHLEITTKGVYALSIKCPESLSQADIEILHATGLTTMLNLEVRPVGLTAAHWDGEGHMVWNLGEDPIIALSCSKHLTEAVVSINGEESVFEWSAGSAELFLQFRDLIEGNHEVKITLFNEGEEDPIDEGLIKIEMQSRVGEEQTGHHRYGLQLLASPSRPTLNEIWSAEATIDVLGPIETPAKLSIQLVGQTSSNILTRGSMDTDLPVLGGKWEQVFGELKEKASKHFDEAEALVLEVTHDAVGTVTLECEREFAALRWVVGKDNRAHLVDLTDAADTTVFGYDYRYPDRELPIDDADTEGVQRPSRGLVVATAGNLQSAFILPPPRTHEGFDDLSREFKLPQLDPLKRSVEAVLSLLKIGALWSSAALPGVNLYAATQRRNVLRAITTEIAGSVGGADWTSIEKLVSSSMLSKDWPTDVNDLLSVIGNLSAIGKKANQRALGEELVELLEPNVVPSHSERVRRFGSALQNHLHSEQLGTDDIGGLAATLLRFASSPGAVAMADKTDWRATVAEIVLSSPVLIRAARLYVWGIHCHEQDETYSPYRGWQWQS